METGPAAIKDRLRGWTGFPLAADPERLIATGRLVSALFAALAIYLDPTRPARSLGEAQAVLIAYVAFSLLLTLYPLRRSLTHRVHILMHGIDLLALGALVWLTGELDSPFFPFVPYILLATTMRWGMRGAVLGAAAIEVMMVTVGWSDLTDGDSELNLLIMRSAYFLVAAAMLGYFGAYRARSRQRFAQLASWSGASASMDERVWMQDVLDHAAHLLGASRLMLVWQDREDTQGQVAMFGPEGLALAKGVSLPVQQGGERAELLSMTQATGWTLPPVKDVRSAPLAGVRHRGRLYVLDAGDAHEDALPLVRITALRIGHELERFALTHAIADRARDQERVRLARDLHDSVLQDLTAATLRLKALSATLAPSDGASLQAVGAMLTAQQRRIRLFVEDSRRLAAVRPLSASLSQNVNDLCDQWGCDIGLTVTPPDMEAPAIVHRELAQLLSEATANAVRHGGATRLSVELQRVGLGLSLSIADNGCGMAASAEAAQLPKSLLARVEDMDGSLAITRYAPGLALRIEVPLP